MATAVGVYAHDQGILRPRHQAFELAAGRPGTVWVTDFGLAKAAQDDDLTHTGDIVGTLGHGARAVSGPVRDGSDLYALGLTLYELLARLAAPMRPTGASSCTR